MPIPNSTAMTTATFRISPELKARVDNLAKMTRRSSSSIYLQLVEDHIGELEEVYRCLAIRDGIKAGTIRTYTTEEAEKELGL
ncbi:MAG TPA: ribbon-helix-helix protein, CopG family [Candidatus Ornithospirochaeta avicola]|uniref:Ribbon-helix-helix protein, CopG family n=1 Tax=Candidatus Ornithospirochaeta avicola TaxID=2840896 RepID=A0A9D1PU19_9SPIO|nr:ribbon-helix-helix protein, CopG family [Candidatus Ornithospirochaeta avicola]